MGTSPDDRGIADLLVMYRETIGPLYKFISCRAGRSRQLAEDITQETYLRAVREWQRGRRPDNPLAWLRTVARNLLVNHYRRKRPESLEPTDVPDLADGGPVDDPDAAALVYWGLSRLGSRKRALLESFYIDGKSTKTIASELGVTQRAIEGRLRRARQALKDRLTPIMRNHGVIS